MGSRVVGVMLLVTALACAGPTKVGKTSATHEDQSARRAVSVLPADADLVAVAKLPFVILNARGGAQVPVDAFFADLASADVVCLAETHSNPHHHYAQHVVFDELREIGTAAGRTVALGMEMFPVTVQGILDDYSHARIDETALLERVSWKTIWGVPFWMYRPMVTRTRETPGQLIGLNTPQELVKRVARKGLASLSDADRKALPELVLDDAEHRAFFDAATQGHGLPGGSYDSFYAAQVLRDEHMAQVTTEWLVAQQGARQLVMLTGGGHCVPSAIPRRITRRLPALRVVIVQPAETGTGEVPTLLAHPEADYLFVMTSADSPASGPTEKTR